MLLHLLHFVIEITSVIIGNARLAGLFPSVVLSTSIWLFYCLSESVK